MVLPIGNATNNIRIAHPQAAGGFFLNTEIKDCIYSLNDYTIN